MYDIALVKQWSEPTSHGSSASSVRRLHSGGRQEQQVGLQSLSSLSVSSWGECGWRTMRHGEPDTTQLSSWAPVETTRGLVCDVLLTQQKGNGSRFWDIFHSLHKMCPKTQSIWKQLNSLEGYSQTIQQKHGTKTMINLGKNKSVNTFVWTDNAVCSVEGLHSQASSTRNRPTYEPPERFCPCGAPEEVERDNDTTPVIACRRWLAWAVAPLRVSRGTFNRGALAYEYRMKPHKDAPLQHAAGEWEREFNTVLIHFHYLKSRPVD